MHTLRPYFLPLLVILLLTGCSRNADLPSIEKADRLYRQALESIAASRPAQAEQLLTEAIGISSNIHNGPMLAECYALLASVQAQSGKISAAVQNYETTRSLYRENADRNGEILAMIETGKAQFRLGLTNESLTTLEEAYLSSQLFRSDRNFAVAALQLGRVNAGLKRWQKASAYFSQASVQFLKNSDLTEAVEANSGNIYSLLQSGNVPAAMQYFRQSETILIDNAKTTPVTRLYTDIGTAFLSNGVWEPARLCFEKAIEWSVRSPRAGNDSVRAYLGLGEVYYNNFAFLEAQQWYLKAYAAAKRENDFVVQAFLLTRIADCSIMELKETASQDEAIRIVQFYEQAQNLFYRAHRPAGEAIVLHRLGIVKQATGDDNAAITHYKRAFEKFSSVFLEFPPQQSPVDLTSLMQHSGKKNGSPVRWFTARLIELLLEQKKYSDAVTYIEREQSLILQQQLLGTDLSFRDRTKDSLFSAWRSANTTKTAAALELQQLAKGTENDYASALQKRYTAARNSTSASAAALPRRFPEFRFAAVNIPGPVVVPQFTALVQYYAARNALWAIVIQDGNRITAVRMKGSALSAAAAMRRYINLLSSRSAQNFERDHLSRELYSLLIAPLERLGQQRFVFIPPAGLEKFPFHALEKNGRPLIDMIEVSYLPSLCFAVPKKTLPSIISTVAAFGFSSDARWGLEFELRDIRSFFRNARIHVNQSASLKTLESIIGESIQISTRFWTTGDGESVFTLSDGTPSIAGFSVPVSSFAHLHPFPLVQLYDVQSQRNSMTPLHTLLWLVNGSPAVIANELPLNPKTSKKFGEMFYSVYADRFDPYGAYRASVRELYRLRESGLLPESYFYFGW